MSAGPIWLTEADVTRLVSLEEALVALERGLRYEGEGKGHNIPKALGRWGHGAMHCLGAMFPEAGYVGWKTWVATKAGGVVSFELFDAATGLLLAVIEAKALGQMRTACITGIGTDWLAAPEATTLALIGTGRYSMTQLAAIAAVRPLRHVMVYSRNVEKRESQAAAMRERFSFDVTAAQSLEEAVAGAEITTLITNAEQPFLSAAMLPPGAHLNAVGAILPTHAEFFSDVFSRCQLIAVDNILNVRQNSREFIEAFGDGDWTRVRPLSQVIVAGEKRHARVDLSLFKAVGMGISDLSIAVEVYQRAAAQGVGQSIGEVRQAQIRWSSRQPFA